MITELKAGLYLYATCAGEDYGKILTVGKDGNGHNVIDIEVNDPDNLISSEQDDSLMTLELPQGVKAILRNVRYELRDADWATLIICDTPANNCYKCTKLFVLNKEPSNKL